LRTSVAEKGAVRRMSAKGDYLRKGVFAEEVSAKGVFARGVFCERGVCEERVSAKRGVFAKGGVE
jgi:hypothetical protein